MPGDNPSYDTKNGEDTVGYQEIPPNPSAQTSSLQERDLDNPIYGSQEDRKFDNPIYATEDSAAQGEESENPYYTIPGSPPSNIYDGVADDQPVDSAGVGMVSISGGLYSTIPTWTIIIAPFDIDCQKCWVSTECWSLTTYHNL